MIRQFSIGEAERAYQFSIDESGWIRAIARADGSTPVIGGQLDLDHNIEVPVEWSAAHEASGNNIKIADGNEFYPGAEFDDSLVDGQVDDVMWAIRRGSKAQQGRLLELGCGPGFLLSRLSAVLPGWSAVGVDPSAVSVGQAKGRGLDVREGFLETADVEGSFDAFVVMGNFQLHNDPAATLRGMAQRANSGAELFLDLKNPKSTPRRLARTLVSTPGLKRIAVVHSFAAHAFHGLRHGIPKEALEPLFESAGWEIVEIRTVGPRLLRFGNKHALAHGPKGAVWRSMDWLDSKVDERAWIQVAARRRAS